MNRKSFSSRFFDPDLNNPGNTVDWIFAHPSGDHAVTDNAPRCCYCNLSMGDDEIHMQSIEGKPAHPQCIRRYEEYNE